MSSTAAPSLRLDEVIDLRRLKAEVVRFYPKGEPLREVLMREPDLQPRTQGLAKLEILVRLVFASRSHRQP